MVEHRSVSRGPSIASCSAAIAAAVLADAKARQERDVDAFERREEAFAQMLRHPLKIALVDSHGRPTE